VKEIDYPYAPVEEGFLDSQIPPKTYAELYKFEENLDHQKTTTGIDQIQESSSDYSMLNARIKPQESKVEEMDESNLPTKRRVRRTKSFDISEPDSDGKIVEDQEVESLRFITRKKGAIIKMVHLWRKDFAELGIQTPLQFWNVVMPAIASAGAQLISKFIDDPRHAVDTIMDFKKAASKLGKNTLKAFRKGTSTNVKDIEQKQRDTWSDYFAQAKQAEDMSKSGDSAGAVDILDTIRKLRDVPKSLMLRINRITTNINRAQKRRLKKHDKAIAEDQAEGLNEAQ
jgi:hypothetical protein